MSKSSPPTGMKKVLALAQKGDVWMARNLARQLSLGPEASAERAEALQFLESTGIPRRAFAIAAVAALLLLAMLLLAAQRG